jgi:ATP-dependent protease ClpP protease subunit
MGFVLLQGCANRYIRPYGRIMQHQISYGVQNEKGKIDSYSKFIDQIEEDLVGLQSDKIGLTKDEFRLKTMNEWWMVGKYAMENNCVDKIVDIYCDPKLTRKNETKDYGFYKLTYSSCPLISDPIEII